MVCYLWYYAGGVGSAENDQKSRIVGIRDGRSQNQWAHPPSILTRCAFGMVYGGEKVVLVHDKQMLVCG